MTATASEQALQGRVALVTGAGRGIGRRIAVGLAALGADVALLARSQDELSAAAREIEALHRAAATIVCDVADTDALAGALQRVRTELGPPTVLVNNAAVVAPLGATAAIDAGAVTAALAINVAAPILLSSGVLPDMTAAGWGRIVNISSGIAGTPGASPGMTVYAASKAALEAHTLNLAAELEGSGVTVNAYRPGAVDTAMQQWIREQPAERVGSALHDRFATMHSSGQLITPEHSAAVLLHRIPGPRSGEIWSVADGID